MQVWPAIDLSDGRVVRLRQGRMGEKTIYDLEPTEIARRWAAEGADGIHVVDLDAAILGEPRNRLVIGEIVAASTIPVQVGGGVRSWEDIHQLRHLGAQRMVLGTRAVTDPAFLREVTEALGEALVVAVDAHEGKVAVEGWQQTTEQDAYLFARWLQDLGVPRLLFTDIATDGVLSGPNWAALERMARTVQIPVLASGGISTLDDVATLRALEPLGIEGFILGRALYEQAVQLDDVVRVAQGPLGGQREAPRGMKTADDGSVR